MADTAQPEHTPEHVLTAFVGHAAPPAVATDRAALALIDFAISVVAGARATDGRRILRAAAEQPALPFEFRIAAVGHVLDCDDNHDTVGGHPSCVLFAALLHAGSTRSRTVNELLAPYVVGLETMAAVARSLGRRPYQEGWHTTCVYGALGAAASLARLTAAKPEMTTAALGMAATMASGVKASFGTDAKPLQVGHAALAGVLAHRLALAGCSASPVAVSGRQGLASLLSVPRPQWDELDALGAQWETVDPGIVFKRYPCCASTHAPIEAVQALRRRGVEPGRIDVTIHAGRLQHVDRPSPRTALEAKFSVQFAVAATWVDGQCALDQFAPERLLDPRVLDVMRRITTHGATQIPWSAARVTSTTPDGMYEMSINAATGHTAETPVTLGDLAAKATSLGITSLEFEQIHDLVKTGQEPVQRLVDLLDATVAEALGATHDQPRQMD